MTNVLRRYTRWLHTRWPAGRVEKLPEVQPGGATGVPGVYVVGDLTGVPLLKFSADTGARVIDTIAGRLEGRGGGEAGVLDVVIIGAGVSGMAAALAARARGLRFEILEATEPFSTIVNFPKAKPIFTYPTGMTPAGELRVSADVKEALVDELRRQTLDAGITPRTARAVSLARRGGRLEVQLAGGEPPIAARSVVVAIGRSGNFRRLGVPGEERDKVYNRLHDPAEFCGQDVLVVGGGDSALETAIALGRCGARVTLSYRKTAFSRPKPENVAALEALARDPGAEVDIESPASERVSTAAGSFMRKPEAAGSVTLMLGSEVQEIRDDAVVVRDRDGDEQTHANDAVFSMIGREPPLDFFRRSGIRIAGELRPADWTLFGLFLAFCVWLYHWKSGGGTILPIHDWFAARGWFPFNVRGALERVSEAAGTPGHLLHVLARGMSDPSFYYTLAYCLCVVIFGLRRIRRRKTPYVRRQTYVLMAIQCVPLFLLPQVFLPWMGENGWFAQGTGGGAVADWFFESYDDSGHDRAWWRAYGLILAWPLFIWNWFTETPLWGWLIVGALQTFVLIPLMIYYWGKGAYCGWICSCGALAETLGDAHRHKMPHGPWWNRLNMTGQVILWIAGVLLLLRIVTWIVPVAPLAGLYHGLLQGWPVVSYKWLVDLMLAGVVGVGCYFWFSGRVWCRFACPLAALMHIYARFSRFRILAEKQKCISCNVCTSVCHQGIDVMNFANKGLPMEDPQCVRCSACVQSCPTGVLSFGQVDRRTGRVIHRDRLAASLVQLTESGRPLRA